MKLHLVMLHAQPLVIVIVMKIHAQQEIDGVASSVSQLIENMIAKIMPRRHDPNRKSAHSRQSFL